MASTQEQQPLPHPYGTTAAPPPTPSSQPNFLSTSAAADALSHLLHRLPPTLSSLSTRRSSPLAAATSPPPIISLTDPTPTLHANLLSASELGFFQLTHHLVPSHLAHSAESDSLALFNLPHDQKQLHFPKNWPLGFDDDDDEENRTSDSFCFDSACSSESAELSLTSLREFTREMEKVGLEVVEALACAVGFENPAREDPTRVCSLMWISEVSPDNVPAMSGKLYPYVIALQYQIRCQKSTMLADSGWVSVSPQVESILVTLGDIAQVWSNGKLKKVRGRPMPSLGDGNISMTLLLTLPLDSIVSPLVPKLIDCNDNGEDDKDDDNGEDDKDDDENENIVEDTMIFNSFSFEDYAWRVYHERLLLKDPLDRYRAS